MLCVDDPVVRELLPEVTRQVITYGFAEDADYRVSDMQGEGLATRFLVHRPGGASALPITLNMPGTASRSQRQNGRRIADMTSALASAACRVAMPVPAGNHS